MGRGSTGETYLLQFEGEVRWQQAMRLSPRDPTKGQFGIWLSDAEPGLGYFDAAIDEKMGGHDAGYRNFYPYLNPPLPTG